MDDKKGEEKVMRNKISALVYVSLLLCGSVVFAAGGVTYYSDPVKGNSGNPGSADKPWPDNLSNAYNRCWKVSM